MQFVYAIAVGAADAALALIVIKLIRSDSECAARYMVYLCFWHGYVKYVLYVLE
jgi:hypothetical protein